MKKYTVYLIRHISTGTVLYVGKTDNFKRRAYEHLSLNTHSKKWLSVIGTGNVLIEAVAEFDNKADALKYEDELILKYDTITNGYNNNRSGLIASNNPEEYHIEYNREYSKTDKYKEYQRKWKREYSKTDKCKKYQREYQREYYKEYKNTDKYKERKKEYQKTDKYREWVREYQRTEKYKEKKREYRKTDEYREKHRKYMRDYMRDSYKAKKLGISVAEYRKLKNDQAIQLTINF